jgi:hypothetical protein
MFELWASNVIGVHVAGFADRAEPHTRKVVAPLSDIPSPCLWQRIILIPMRVDAGGVR